jgi:hypothetical protein
MRSTIALVTAAVVAFPVAASLTPPATGSGEDGTVAVPAGVPSPSAEAQPGFDGSIHANPETGCFEILPDGFDTELPSPPEDDDPLVGPPVTRGPWPVCDRSDLPVGLPPPAGP